MSSILRSRNFHVSVVVASLLFALWFSISMWTNAYEQRKQAYTIQQVNQQEEMIFQLSDALSAERQLMYALFNEANYNPDEVAHLQSLAAFTDQFVSDNAAAFIIPSSGSHHHSTSSVSHAHGSAGADMASLEPQPMDHSAHGMAAAMPESPDQFHPADGMHKMDEAPDGKDHSSHDMVMADAESGGMDHSTHGMKPANAMPEVVSPPATGAASYQVAMGTMHNVVDHEAGVATAVISRLREDDAKLYEQLQMPRVERDPGYGMKKFHDYMNAILAIDRIRHSLHTHSTDSLPEHYIVTKLKDAFWDFREYSAQTTSLLEGVAAMSGTATQRAHITHQADMLMELNVKVDVSWDTLYKSIQASGNKEMLNEANTVAAWYNENFRSMSFKLMASAREDTLSVNDLNNWLKAAYRLSASSEEVRTQAKEMTAMLIDNVVQRTNANLIRISILLLFSVVMTLASVLFFRRVDRQAHQDELTGLDNRRMFALAVERHLASSSGATGIMMIDLDRFKHINDTMGHAAGDRLLKDVAERISSAGSECVSISRLGGDEFALLFSENTIDTMQSVAESIRHNLKEPFLIGGATLKIGSSIGCAMSPRDANSTDSLIQAADLAMYCAKKSGTNQIAEYDSEVDQSMMIAARTVSELQSALKNNEFELHYQPQFNIAEAKVLSAEALIRWNHPERGFLTPNHFITIAEENGLMPAIGNWVIAEACRQAADWLHNKNMPLRVAINISSDHFFQNDFIQVIVDSLEKHKLPPHLLEVEVTESVAMSDINLVVKSLQQLRDMSVNVALDDFGTGYSSLSYLQELPLDTLKIDKSFIQNMLQGSARKESITETIISLGNRLNLETVAEGVETVDQLSAVSDMKITVVQGYYYSRPVSANELEYVVRQLNEDKERKNAA